MVRTVQTLLHSQLACNEMQASARTCGRQHDRKCRLKSSYFHHPSQGNSANYYLILGLRDETVPPTSQQINKFPPKRVKNLETPSSIFIFVFSSSTGELCSQPIRGEDHPTGRMFPEHVERRFLDPEYSFNKYFQLGLQRNIRPIKNGLYMFFTSTYCQNSTHTTWMEQANKFAAYAHVYVYKYYNTITPPPHPHTESPTLSEYLSHTHTSSLVSILLVTENLPRSVWNLRLQSPYSTPSLTHPPLHPIHSLHNSSQQNGRAFLLHSHTFGAGQQDFGHTHKVSRHTHTHNARCTCIHTHTHTHTHTHRA